MLFSVFAATDQGPRCALDMPMFENKSAAAIRFMPTCVEPDRQQDNLICRSSGNGRSPEHEIRSCAERCRHGRARFRGDRFYGRAEARRQTRHRGFLADARTNLMLITPCRAPDFQRVPGPVLRPARGTVR